MNSLLSEHDIHMNTFFIPRTAAPPARFSPEQFFATRPGMYRQQPYAMRPRKPGLFVIGAMKSGTTYLNKLLGAHPEIFMCSPEEPSYFVEPGQLRTLWPEAWDQGFWRSEEHYLRLFQDCGDALVLGESSTNYTKGPLVDGVPERIHDFNPDARFIYLMRDPIERTISHYWHMVRYHAERRPMLEAIKTDPQYLDVSHYAMQLMPFLDQFGPEHVAVLTFEQLTRDPVEAMRPLYEWLDVDATLADASRFDEAENVTPDVLRMAAWHGALQQLRQSRPFRLLTPYLPRRLRERAVRLATRQVERRALDISGVVEALRPIQLLQTAALARLVGREFPEWTTLYGKAAAPSPFVGREVLHES
jgi:Sulfotransferase family